MSVKTQTCVWVECDSPTCANRAEGGWDEGAPHFSSEAEALDYVLGDENGCGWTKRPDGRLLCRSCSGIADCEATGHQWMEWRPDARDEDVEWRYCSHCGSGFQQRIAGTDVIL